jgi:hypothetical protein
VSGTSFKRWRAVFRRAKYLYPIFGTPVKPRYSETIAFSKKLMAKPHLPTLGLAFYYFNYPRPQNWVLKGDFEAQRLEITLFYSLAPSLGAGVRGVGAILRLFCEKCQTG